MAARTISCCSCSCIAVEPPEGLGLATRVMSSTSKFEKFTHASFDEEERGMVSRFFLNPRDLLVIRVLDRVSVLDIAGGER